MALDIKITPLPGADKIFTKMANMAPVFKEGIRQGWFEAAKVLTKEVRNQMTSAKSGIKRRSLPNRSSAPGESAANQSGTLLRSFGTSVQGYDKLTIGWGINSAVPKHADFVEATRPTLKNTFDAKEGQVVVEIIEEIKREVNK